VADDDPSPDQSDYSRAVLLLRARRLLTIEDAAELIGHVLTSSLHGVVVGDGVITDAQVVGDGTRFRLVTESGGRCCRVCNEIYPDDQVDAGLSQIGALQAVDGPEPECLAGLPYWASVCADRPACAARWTLRQTAGHLREVADGQG